MCQARRGRTLGFPSAGGHDEENARLAFGDGVDDVVDGYDLIIPRGLVGGAEVPILGAEGFLL